MRLRLCLGVLVRATAACILAASVSFADDYRFPIADPLKSSLLPAGYRPLRSDYATSFLEVRADTICLHGDTPGAVAIAAEVRGGLEAAGVTIAPLMVVSRLW